jgi:glycosyltransferase involved in cell wall biosynthesis
MSKNRDISIVVPVYNEEEVLEQFIKSLLDNLKQIRRSFEIIFVDDGSVDNSIRIIKKYKSENDSVKYISFTRNFGHQYALLEGIKRSSGAAVIMMDSDLQHPPSLIKDLIEEWDAGTKVVQTVRRDQKISFIKKMTSKLFYFILNLISDLDLTLYTADFRLIDREVVAKLLEFQENDIFLRGLIPWLGYQISYIEFNAEPRYAGKSKYSMLKMLKFAITGLTSFTTFPLRIASVMGVVISIISFCVGIQAIYARMFTDKTIIGWTSVMTGVFFIGGIIMLFLGILGEYLGRVFIEVKHRPKYIIKEMSGFEEKK